MDTEEGIPLYTLQYTDSDGDILGIAPVPGSDPVVSFEIGDGSGTDEAHVVYIPTTEVHRVTDAIRKAAALAEHGRGLR